MQEAYLPVSLLPNQENIRSPPPQGWTIEEDGDESAVAFSSPNGSDLLEAYLCRRR